MDQKCYGFYILHSQERDFGCQIYNKIEKDWNKIVIFAQILVSTNSTKRNDDYELHEKTKHNDGPAFAERRPRLYWM